MASILRMGARAGYARRVRLQQGLPVVGREEVGWKVFPGHDFYKPVLW